MARILVVDDSAIARQVTGALLEGAEQSVLYAASGREALELVSRDHPDAVLTDLQMPEMNGLQLVQKMRRDHPGTPVILMTAHGGEQTAVAALKAGAASYVPKQSLDRDLTDVLRIVLGAVESRAHRLTARRMLKTSRSEFVLGYEADGSAALVGHLTSGLLSLNFCDESEVFQVSTALSEALVNAIEHGNLELDSALREASYDDYERLRDERMAISPYRDRTVYVSADMIQDSVTYIVRDEGPGFDPATLPDPMDPANLLRASGRGVMLIKTFMDEVTFNAKGNEIRMTKRRLAEACSR